MSHSDLPGHPLGRKFLTALLHLAIKLLVRLEVTAVDHIPATGPVVIIINHIAFLDPVAVLGIIPRVVTPMAKVEILSLPLCGWLARIYGAIPVHRGEADLEAMKSALRVLKQGGIILLAPEGTRSRTYQLQPAKDGAVILALRGQAAIIPIGVTGTHQVKSYWLRLRRPLIRVSVGPPFHLPSPANKKQMSRSEISALTTQAMVRLANQLPQEFRGVYQTSEESNLVKSNI